jgi:hypothetical protein
MSQPAGNPKKAAYESRIQSVLNSDGFKASAEADKREQIGETIYDAILEATSEEAAPKVTGMIIDLPLDDLVTAVGSWDGIQEKVKEGMELLGQEAK